MNRSIVLFSFLADVSHGKHAYPDINNETKFFHDGMLLAFWCSKIDFISVFVLPPLASGFFGLGDFFGYLYGRAREFEYYAYIL